MPRKARLLLTIFLAVYGAACLAHPEAGGFLDAVDLGIHETGHLVFAPFGEFVGFAGGTLAQLIMPSLFAAYFWRQEDRHAATVAFWWLAQNCWNISVYAADARAQDLPLVGGGEHDWAYMLGRLGWLQLDTRISRLIWLVGVLVYVMSIVQGVRYARAASERSARATGSSTPSQLA
ncbi:MAG TPA: hypothetical protein VFK39_04800 [Gemmatimonadaceae bacterium]|nr:hypothetical protein [Gemmatimonadaceae bacterium]